MDPDFLVIGAAKAGTSWLWCCLREHPDLFLPDEKELHYFDAELYDGSGRVNRRSELPWAWYQSQFSDASAEQLCGEITPSYLASRTAPGRIAARLPRASLICMLRDPVERIRSDIAYKISRGALPPRVGFDEALGIDPDLLERSKYGTHVQRYLQFFPADQLLLLDFAWLRSKPSSLLRRVEAFLAIPPFGDDVARTRSVNVTGLPKHPLLVRATRLALNAAKGIGLQLGVERALRARGISTLAQRMASTRPVASSLELPQVSVPERIRQLLDAELDLLEEMTGFRLSGPSAGRSR